MPSYEPYWDTEHGRWPGTHDVNGNRINDDVIYESHIGVWCDWKDMSGLGVVASDELRFSADGRFVWLSLTYENRKMYLVKREGVWQQSGEILTLQIESSDEPDVIPRHRTDLKIMDRQGRLYLEQIRLDDEIRDNICSYFLLPARAGDAARVLEAAQSKSRPAGALPRPFSSLETLLGMAIPTQVKKLQLTEPIFCLRLYYWDTHAPGEDYQLGVRVLTEPLRRHCVAKCSHHSHPAHLAGELWSPQSGVANGWPGKDEGLYQIDLRGSKELAKYFDEVYELLDVDSDENMPLLCELARRVCKKLNAYNWQPPGAVTDDFVAVPADGSGFFGGAYEEDMEAAVSAERIELLRKRGYLAWQLGQSRT